MNIIVQTLRNIWRGLFFANFVLTFFLLFPLFYIFLLRAKWFPLVVWLKRVWAHLIMCPLGIFYSVKREAEIDPHRAYVFCSNHTSYLDVIFSYLVIPAYYHFMAKAELKKLPLFGLFFKRMNIPVDRSSARDSHRAFQRAASDIDKGISIALFPEGTIPNNAPKLGRFKNGPFRLAIEKQVPIVPITFINNWQILPMGRRSKRGGQPGITKAIMHKPIETKGLKDTDVEALKNQVFTIIDKTLKTYGNNR